MVLVSTQAEYKRYYKECLTLASRYSCTKRGLTGKAALLFLPFTSNATSAKLAAVTHVANIRHIDILSFLFMDDKSHFHIALWSLAFCASSEENR